MKRRLVKGAFLEYPYTGLLLHNALSFCPVFFKMLSIRQLNLASWSIFTPSNFSHLLF